MGQMSESIFEAQSKTEPIWLSFGTG